MKHRILMHLAMACAIAISFSVACHASEPIDSLSLRTGMTDWVDPVTAVPQGCTYVTYPSTHRGENTEASCLVYLPPTYQTDTTARFPVIYYLHGGTGNQREVRWLVNHVDNAIRNGNMEPVIIVAPQALPIGWYINANTSDPKVTSGPIEDVLIYDLLPYIDSNFRTIADAKGIEGFSMGGRGALMLAFKHPDIFKAASSVAGAVVNWDEEPLQRALECTFGDVNNEMSRIYFDAWHPMTFACQNRNKIIDSGMEIRMFVGDKDRLYDENGNHITERFHSQLDTLNIKHTYTVIPGANHNPNELFPSDSNSYDTSFWDNAFSKYVKPNYPAEIIAFSEKYFPGQQIEKIEELPDSRGTHYMVSMSNGISVKLNEKFNWIKIQIPDTCCVPSDFLLPDISDYLASNGVDVCNISVIEKIPRVGYEISIKNSDKKFTFDTKGKLIEQK